MGVIGQSVLGESCASVNDHEDVGDATSFLATNNQLIDQEAGQQEQEATATQELDESSAQEQNPLSSLNKVLQKAAALSKAGQMNAKETQIYTDLLKALKSAQGVMTKQMQDLIKSQAKALSDSTGTKSAPSTASTKVATELEKAQSAQVKSLELQREANQLLNEKAALKTQAYQAEKSKNASTDAAAQNIKKLADELSSVDSSIKDAQAKERQDLKAQDQKALATYLKVVADKKAITSGANDTKTALEAKKQTINYQIGNATYKQAGTIVSGERKLQSIQAKQKKVADALNKVKALLKATKEKQAGIMKTVHKLSTSM